MNLKIKKNNYFLFTILILSQNFIKSCINNTCSILKTPLSVKTIFIPISQGQNLYTQYHKPIYINNEDSDFCLVSDFSITYRYSKTRNSDCIANSLFQYNPLLFVGGNDDLSRPFNALIPEYFGMSSDTNTSIYLNPNISNNIVDFQLALSGDCFWAQVNLPFVGTTWNLNNNCPLTQTINQNSFDNSGLINISQSADVTLDKKYFLNGSTGTSNNGLLSSDNTFIDNYISSNLSLVNESNFSVNNSGEVQNNIMILGNWGSPSYNINLTADPIVVLDGTTNKSLDITQGQVNSAKTITEALGGYTFGDLKNRTYNLFNFGNNGCNNNIGGLADIIFQLGWDFLKEDSKHCGIYLRLVFPTGTDLNRYWAQYVFSPIIGNGKHFEFGAGLSFHGKLFECNDSDLSANFDGYITHMCGANSFRSFDKNGYPMSRYALLKQLKYNIDAENKFQYNGSGNIVALGDLNNQCINTSLNIRGEAILDFIYTAFNWELGLGYALSGQSGESINTCNESCLNSNLNEYFYGYKGKSGLTDFILNTNNTTLIPNNTTPVTIDMATFSAQTDANVSINGTSGAYLYGSLTKSGPSSVDLFKLPDINCSGLMGAQFLNRIFAHIDYVWRDNCWQPEFGILGSFGFQPSKYLTAVYWDMGARIGFAF